MKMIGLWALALASGALSMALGYKAEWAALSLDDFFARAEQVLASKEIDADELTTTSRISSTRWSACSVRL